MYIAGKGFVCLYCEGVKRRKDEENSVTEKL